MQVAFECGIRKVIDGSGKRMDGIGVLIRRAVKVSYDFPDELPLLTSFGGQLRQWVPLTISFRRNGRFRWAYYILCTVVSWLSGCYIEDGVLHPSFSAECLV